MRLSIIVLALILLYSCEADIHEETTGTQSDTIAKENPQHAAPQQSLEEDTIGSNTNTDSEWTAGIRMKENKVTAVATLTKIRTASKEGFDRIVFEFAGTELPSWHVEYIDKPVRQCGSGNTTDIAGDGWLEIRMEPAQAHDENGQATVGERERKFTYTNLKELEITCDFEATTTVVAGVGSPNKYRIIELKNPARLVVDVGR